MEHIHSFQQHLIVLGIGNIDIVICIRGVLGLCVLRLLPIANQTTFVKQILAADKYAASPFYPLLV